LNRLIRLTLVLKNPCYGRMDHCSSSNRMRQRCPWAENDPVEKAYHDVEWGTPLFDDQRLFEFLVLEGAQAGLSWKTILYKREGYRSAFDRFDPAKVARYDETKITQLQKDAAIIRNRQKIISAVNNARLFLSVQAECNGFHNYIWDFVDKKPIVNYWQTMKDVPAQTPQSERMSADLYARGFRFVGPVICYAYMQATGMVNDHLVSCFRHKEVQMVT